MDKQREAFEAWMKREYPHRTDGYIEWHDIAGEYALDEVQFAFEAWQAAQQAKWLPIETAPRDETPILAYAKSVFGVVDISAMFFVDGDWYWFLNGDYPAVQPTHWMPLPPEPKK